MLGFLIRTVACLFLMLPAGAKGNSSLFVAWKVPAFSTVQQAYQGSDVRILDRNGQLLGNVRQNFMLRQGQWRSLKEISPAVLRAVILSEDQRFQEHDGVDWQAVLNALWQNVFSEHRRGASTITMQVAGFLDAELAKAGQRSFMNKLEQAYKAHLLEQVWSKRQILEAYLNLAPFRGELKGIDALSSHLFGKQVWGLDTRDAAVVAALLRNPNASAVRLQAPVCTILLKLDKQQNCDDLPEFLATLLSVRRSLLYDASYIAPHFSRWAWGLADKKNQNTLVTNLDARLQRYVIRSIERHLQTLQAANVRDAAAIVLNNHNGEILAYVGSSGRHASASQVDHVRALRQPGSALKPFLYALAMQEKHLTAASLLDNRRLNLSTASGLYIPRNYDEQFSSWVSARFALASSLNIPAVRTLMLAGTDKLVATLLKLGLPLEEQADFYGYSLALGSAEVSLLSLTNAYRALANGGDFTRYQVFPDKAKQKIMKNVLPVFTPETAWLIGNILSDRQARLRTFGPDSVLSTPFWTAVKTGTSKSMRDNWAIGWSQDYTVGVWVGNSSGASMHKVSGMSGAGPIWNAIMLYLHAGKPSHEPAMPAGLDVKNIRFEQAIEPERQEYFLPGTAIETVRLAYSEQSNTTLLKAHILSPVDQTVFAMDPGIPSNNQRIELQASLAGPEVSSIFWTINQKKLGQGRQLWWPPRPGRHRVALHAPDGSLLDEVVIIVRP